MIAERWTDQEGLKQGNTMPFFKNSEVHRFLPCPKTSHKAFQVGESPGSPAFFVSAALSQGRKDTKMSKSIDAPNPKEFYYPNRDCCLSVDGKFYTYKVWDEVAKCVVTQKIEVGKDLSLDITLVLDELDHDDDLKELYERKHRSHYFNRAVESYQSGKTGEDTIDPWETIDKKSKSLEDIIFAEPESENPQIAQVRSIIDEKCTEEQKKFIADHFGKQMKLEEMRQTEAKATGKLPSAPAMTQRKMKIIDKIAKALGVERPKRYRRSSDKD